MSPLTISCFSFLLLILLHSPNGSSNPDYSFFQTCSTTFTCGNTITGIGFPFWRADDVPPYCGHPGFALTCDDRTNVTNINITNTKYRVLEIDQNGRTMRIAREDIMEETCPTEMMNTTLDYSIFDYDGSCKNVTFFYGCPYFPDLNSISCGKDSVYVIPGNMGPGICKYSVVVAGTWDESRGTTVNATELDHGLQQGFQIKWKVDSEACSGCTASKGRCGYNWETNRTVCYCPDSPYISDTCKTSNETSSTPDKASSPTGTYVF